MQSARTMIQAPPAHQRQLGRVPVSARYPHYQYKRFPPAKLVPGRAYRDSWLVSRRAHPCRARPRPCSPPATLTVTPAVLAPLCPPPAVSATAVLSPGRARPRPCLPRPRPGSPLLSSRARPQPGPPPAVSATAVLSPGRAYRNPSSARPAVLAPGRACHDPSRARPRRARLLRARPRSCSLPAPSPRPCPPPQSLAVSKG